ncbi:MAG: DnaJ domain-containing protein [Roseivirga sp.]|nr:DnaJ domain-containing protein [Roseivirga sp.]
MPRDYYEILGVLKDANAEDIKRAFRQKARSLHPDINQSPDALSSFQELQQAYEVLKDPERKERYDTGEALPEPVEHERSQPQRSYQSGGAWNSFSKYDPEYGYVDTDYAHYNGLTTFVGIITLLFATTFLIDFLFATESYNQTVVSVQNKGLITKKPDDLSLMIIQTSDLRFEKTAVEAELVAGEFIDIKKSLIYGFLQFKRSDESSYQRTTSMSLVNYVLAIIVYIAALNAILNKKHQERKFNAAIIAAFFSVMLLFFALVF